MMYNSVVEQVLSLKYSVILFSPKYSINKNGTLVILDPYKSSLNAINPISIKFLEMLLNYLPVNHLTSILLPRNYCTQNKI